MIIIGVMITRVTQCKIAKATVFQYNAAIVSTWIVLLLGHLQPQLSIKYRCQVQRQVLLGLQQDHFMQSQCSAHRC